MEEEIPCQHQVKEGPCSQHLLLLLRILKTQWSVSPAQPWASCPVSRDSSVNTCWKKRIVGLVFLVDSLSQCPWKRLIFLFKKKKNWFLYFHNCGETYYFISLVSESSASLRETLKLLRGLEEAVHLPLMPSSLKYRHLCSSDSTFFHLLRPKDLSCKGSLQESSCLCGEFTSLGFRSIFK